MNKVEIGRAFEEQAKIFLEENGYIIKSWYSKKNWCAPCDMLVEKDGKEMYCEIRGRNDANGSFVFSRKKMDNLIALSEHKPMLFVLIRDDKIRIVSINDLPRERYVSYHDRKSSPNYYRLVEKLEKNPRPLSTTTLKINMSDNIWKKWASAKSYLGKNEPITNAEAIEKLIDFYNKCKTDTSMECCTPHRMTTLKADLSDGIWKKWSLVKAEIGAGKPISSEKTIEKLIDDYNKNKGRQII